MTDEEVFSKCCYKKNKQQIYREWTEVASRTSSSDLIQFLRYTRNETPDIIFDGWRDTRAFANELKRRTIPDELKLEVLLLLGDEM